MATGTSVFTEVPCVLAGMQRGSSVRSHQSGVAGTSRIWALSPQPSAESRSHMQSAAFADAASSNSIEAMASAWRRVLMKAKSKSTATGSACKKSLERSSQRSPKERDREGWRRGVKPGCKMWDSGRGERTDWSSVSPPVAHGVNTGPRGAIPSRVPVLRSGLETLGSSSSRGVRASQSRRFVPLPVPRSSGSAGTTAGNRGSCECGRCR